MILLIVLLFVGKLFSAHLFLNVFSLNRDITLIVASCQIINELKAKELRKIKLLFYD